MTHIEFLILANHAEAKEGLLYVLGGGWTDHWRQVPKGGPIPASHFGVGVGVIVEWTDTNRPHHLTIRFETDDGKEVGRVEGDLEVGRPPGLPAGSDQRAVLAFNGDFQWPSSGGYRVVARLGSDSATDKIVRFRVHDQPLEVTGR
ncbi:MAG: DUF6941 family protein [bacterium]